jgi:hypothetical protein
MLVEGSSGGSGGAATVPGIDELRQGFQGLQELCKTLAQSLQMQNDKFSEAETASLADSKRLLDMTEQVCAPLCVTVFPTNLPPPSVGSVAPTFPDPAASSSFAFPAPRSCFCSPRYSIKPTQRYNWCSRFEGSCPCSVVDRSSVVDRCSVLDFVSSLNIRPCCVCPHPLPQFFATESSANRHRQRCLDVEKVLLAVVTDSSSVVHARHHTAIQVRAAASVLLLYHVRAPTPTVQRLSCLLHAGVGFELQGFCGGTAWFRAHQGVCALRQDLRLRMRLSIGCCQGRAIRGGARGGPSNRGRGPAVSACRQLTRVLRYRLLGHRTACFVAAVQWVAKSVLLRLLCRCVRCVTSRGVAFDGGVVLAA